MSNQASAAIVTALNALAFGLQKEGEQIAAVSADQLARSAADKATIMGHLSRQHRPPPRSQQLSDPVLIALSNSSSGKGHTRPASGFALCPCPVPR
jgi:hypothetical protein